MRKFLALLGILLILVIISITTYTGIQRYKKINQFSFLVKQGKGLAIIYNQLESIPKQAKEKLESAEQDRAKIEEICDRISIYESDGFNVEFGWTFDEKEGALIDEFADITPTQESLFDRYKSEVDYLYRKARDVEEKTYAWQEAEYDNAVAEAILIKNRLTDKHISRDLLPLRRNLILMANFLYDYARFKKQYELQAHAESPFTQKDIDEFMAAQVRVNEEIEQFCQKWWLNTSKYIVDFN